MREKKSACLVCLYLAHVELVEFQFPRNFLFSPQCSHEPPSMLNASGTHLMYPFEVISFLCFLFLRRFENDSSGQVQQPTRQPNNENDSDDTAEGNRMP